MIAAHTLKVGELFHPGARGGMPEGSHYAWDPRADGAHHRLTVFAARPSTTERLAFESGGRVELGLVVDGPAIVLLWAGAGWGGWSDATYSWHLQAKAPGRGELGVPDTAALSDAVGVPLDMILVDGSDGRIVRMRKVAMPGSFATALHKAIAAQAAAPWDVRAFDARIAAHSRMSLQELTKRASATCTLGSGR